MFHPCGVQFTIACHNMMACNMRKCQVRPVLSEVHIFPFTCSMLATETLEQL